jgi:predicted secreted protein
MTMNSRTLALTFRGMLLASAVLLPAVFLRAEAPVVVGPKQSGRTVTVTAGGILEVRLSAQLGTGYGWHITDPAEAVLAKEGEPKTEPAPEGKPMPGGPEIQVFRFTAKAAGKADLKLQYFREFEAGKKPLRTATFHIVVVAAKG